MAEATGGTGNPAGGDPNAGAGGQPSGGTPNPTGGGQAPVGGQPGGGGGAGGGAAKTYSFTEDRSDWIDPKSGSHVPRTRLNEQSEEIKKLRQELSGTTDRIKKAFGVETPSAEDTEADEVRKALLKVYPNLAVLEKLDPETLDRLLNGVESAQNTTNAQWQRHAQGLITNIAATVAKSVGIEKVSAKGRKQIEAAFRDEAMANFQERAAAVRGGTRATTETVQGDTDFIARYEAGDEALVKEFADSFLKEWYEPARRSATADAARRNMRPVPRGERQRTPITAGEGGTTLNLANDKDFKEALIKARNASAA